MGLWRCYKEPLRAVWRIEETAGEMMKLFTDEELSLFSMDVLKTEKRRQEWLAVRLLLKELPGNNNHVAYHRNGAPFLPDSPYNISITHTRGYAAVLLQEKAYAGLDMEYRSDRALRLRSKFLSSEEEISIDTFHEADHLLLYWCAKETLFKLIGQEGVDFREHLHVDPFPFARSGVFTVRETRTSRKQSFRLGFSVEDDFVWTWSL